MSAAVGAVVAAPTRGRRWLPIAVTATVVGYVAVYASWTALHWSGDRTVVSDVAPIPLAFAATVLAWQAANSAAVPLRRQSAWRWIAFGCASWTLAECLWFYFEVVRDVAPFPSPADAFYLAFYVFVFAGLVRLPLRTLSRKERVAFALDLATVMFVTLMVVWYLVVEPTVNRADGVLSQTLSLAYPVGDVILLLGVARVLMRRRAGSEGTVPLWFLTGGAVLLAVADVVYARLELEHSYVPGTLPDVLWVCALGAFAIAAAAELWYQRPADVEDRPDVVVGVSRLPYVAVVVGLALVLAETARDVDGPLALLVLGALGLTVIVVVRQVIVQRDNEHLVAELHRLAHTDPLTALPNRRQLFDAAPLLVAGAYAQRRPVTVVMADVDNFKAINDAYGHAAGDEVLRVVAARCANVVRPSDFLARFAGDEFVAVIVGNAASARREIADRLSRAVAQDPIMTTAGLVPTTLSIGVATSLTEPLDRLLQEADIALLDAKRAGRRSFDVAGTGVGTARTLGVGGRDRP
jgi:diguanylate cyclase (GGDEF)-like protein